MVAQGVEPPRPEAVGHHLEARRHQQGVGVALVGAPEVGVARGQGVAQAGGADQRAGGGPHGAHARDRHQGPDPAPSAPPAARRRRAPRPRCARAIRSVSFRFRWTWVPSSTGRPSERGGPRGPEARTPVAPVEEVPGDDAQRAREAPRERRPLCPASQASTIPRRAPSPLHPARPLGRGLLDGGRPRLRGPGRLLPAVLPAGLLGVGALRVRRDLARAAGCSAARPPTRDPAP